MSKHDNMTKPSAKNTTEEPRSEKRKKTEIGKRRK